MLCVGEVPEPLHNGDEVRDTRGATVLSEERTGAFIGLTGEITHQRAFAHEGRAQAAGDGEDRHAVGELRGKHVCQHMLGPQGAAAGFA